jgi:hypothetical protein
LPYLSFLNNRKILFSSKWLNDNDFCMRSGHQGDLDPAIQLMIGFIVPIIK